MILPSIIKVSMTALEAVPKEYEDASLALGATPTETWFRVSVPAARSGIAAAVVLGFVLWGAVSMFGVPNMAMLAQQPTAPHERFGTKVSTAVSGFYKSLDDTFKSFTLTAENGLDQIRTQSIGGSTAKGE